MLRRLCPSDGGCMIAAALEDALVSVLDAAFEVVLHTAVAITLEFAPSAVSRPRCSCRSLMPVPGPWHRL
jgi:hypothetical protein